MPRRTRYRPHCILLTLILVASYSLPYSSRLTHSHTRRVLLAIVHTTSILIVILLIVVVLITSCSLHGVHHVVLIASGSSRRVIFANFPLLPILSNAMRVKTAAMDVTLGACAGNAKCGSSIYRYTLDIENRTGLSHNAWNPLCVCECDASICCDILCLDSQRNHGAMMTRIVRMPFALTQLRPEGKCPDTVRPERKKNALPCSVR